MATLFFTDCEVTFYRISMLWFSGTKAVYSVCSESALHFLLGPCSSKLKALTQLVEASEEDLFTQSGYSCSEIIGVDVRALSESAGKVVGNE